MANAPIVIIENKQRLEKNLHVGERLVVKRSGQDSAPATEISRSGESFDPLTTAPIFVNSPHVSQKHAEIHQTGDGRVFVKDLNSLNGTFLRLHPYQEVELDGPFELLLGQDVVIKSQNNLWPPRVKGITNPDDLMRYVKLQIGKYVESVVLGTASEAENSRAVGKCTKVPLLERNAYVVVQWKQATFNLDLERWLQTVVYLYNSGPAQKIEESWQFLAASPDRMRTLLLAKQIAPTDSTVLLYGRSGAGKDVLARDIHRHSARSKGPFIAINCGALPETIIESELFGTRTGAYTGAVDRIGLIEQAHNGTLFLDEIGELPLALQVKLLRVLETRCVRRVGAGGEEKPVNVRIIAATNKNLDRMVQEKTFREDLLFRLDSMKLVIPDLGPSDVRALCPPLLLELARRGLGVLPSDESEQIIQYAQRIVWQGNGRQLRHFLERYMTLRHAERSFEQNWAAVVEMEQNQYNENRPADRSGRSNPCIVVDVPAAVPVPEDPMSIKDFIDHLIFLHIAREVLPANRWGAIAELGRRTNMTGAGAKNRLQKLGIVTDPVVDIHQLDAKIAELKQQLQPSLAYLQSILA